MSSPAPTGPPASALPPPGAVVGGKYRIEALLGKGGMGVVVRATHLQLGEPVALKFLHGEIAGDRAHVERFLREARAAARIKSEHVARVFDVGTLPGGEPYMVMELLLGDDLHALGRRRGPLPAAEAIEYVVQACHAIAEAHHHGIVHRDLKPANLFLTTRGDGSPLVKVLDFGISKSVDAADQSLTATGDVLGSPLYMAPEQIRDSRRVDARCDIWALGNILYKLLSGRAPFAADSSAGTLASIIADPVPSLRVDRPDLPPELEAIILRCLEKSPAQRIQRVEDLASALASVLPLVPAHGTGPALASPSIETTATESALSAQRPAPRGRWLAVPLGVLLATTLGGVLAVVVLRRAPGVARTTGSPELDAPATTTDPGLPPSAAVPAVSRPTVTERATSSASVAAPPVVLSVSSSAPPAPPVSAVNRPAAKPPARGKPNAYDDRL